MSRIQSKITQHKTTTTTKQPIFKKRDNQWRLPCNNFKTAKPILEDIDIYLSTHISSMNEKNQIETIKKNQNSKAENTLSENATTPHFYLTKHWLGNEAAMSCKVISTLQKAMENY